MRQLIAQKGSERYLGYPENKKPHSINFLKETRITNKSWRNGSENCQYNYINFIFVTETTSDIISLLTIDYLSMF